MMNSSVHQASLPLSSMRRTTYDQPRKAHIAIAAHNARQFFISSQGITYESRLPYNRVCRINSSAIEQYQRIARYHLHSGERFTDLNVGIRRRDQGTPDRCGRGRYWGTEADIISPNLRRCNCRRRRAREHRRARGPVDRVATPESWGLIKSDRLRSSAHREGLRRRNHRSGNRISKRPGHRRAGARASHSQRPQASAARRQARHHRPPGRHAGLGRGHPPRQARRAGVCGVPFV